MLHRNVWDAAKAELEEKFIALSEYIRKERTETNNLSFHHRKPEKEEQFRANATRRK